MNVKPLVSVAVLIGSPSALNDSGRNQLTAYSFSSPASKCERMTADSKDGKKCVSLPTSLPSCRKCHYFTLKVKYDI